MLKSPKDKECFNRTPQRKHSKLSYSKYLKRVNSLFRLIEKIVDEEKHGLVIEGLGYFYYNYTTRRKCINPQSLIRDDIEYYRLEFIPNEDYKYRKFITSYRNKTKTNKDYEPKIELAKYLLQ
jgi:hypothetical protein